MAEWRTERMAEWSNGRNGYVRTIYGRHTHTDDTDDDDNNDTSIFYSIDVIVRKYMNSFTTNSYV